jgi:type IV secretory pathway TrbF-like protein
MAANPYVQGWREWDERYADHVLGNRNWQIAAGCSLLVSLVLAVGIVWLALRSHYVPYIVVTDRLGQAITISEPITASSMSLMAARMERREVPAVIRVARSSAAGLIVRGWFDSVPAWALARRAIDRRSPWHRHSTSNLSTPRWAPW